MKKITLLIFGILLCSTLVSQTFRSLTLQNATINGLTVTGSAPEFTVTTGASISGNYDVLFETDFPSSHVFPLAGTPNWGDKQNDYWQDQNDMTSGNIYSGAISLTAPSSAGTYYIIISVMSEYNAGQIVSATHWRVESLIWDDGNDLFDLSSTQIQNGINTGSITHSMYNINGFSDESYGLTAIKLNVESGNSGYRRLTLQNTTVNGSTVSGSAPEFSVNTGDNISGSYNVLFETDYPSSHVFPLAGTPNWGDKQNDYWQDQNDMSNGNTYSGTISLTAPNSVGTYYIIISVMSEYNAGQIVSATHWRVESLIWDDGNDLFDLSSTQIQNGINTGSITHSMYNINGFSDESFGLTAIKLNVGTSDITDNSISNKVSIFPNPVNNVLNIVLQENDNYKVNIYNSLGQFIYSDDLHTNHNTIEMSKLHKGIYFVVINDMNGNVLLSKKIVKE